MCRPSPGSAKRSSHDRRDPFTRAAQLGRLGQSARRLPDPEPAALCVRPAGRRCPWRRRDRGRRLRPRRGARARPVRRAPRASRRGCQRRDAQPAVRARPRGARRAPPPSRRPSRRRWPRAHQGRSAAVAPPPPRRGLSARTSGRHRRLHRLLRRHPPRHQRRQAVPPRQPAAAELQIRADRLSRPRLLHPVSGTTLRRPSGQRKPSTETVPSFGPSRSLDYELELAVWIGPGNELGTPIAIADAASHIAGFCLLNDWSAHDIQAWEYQPLGPFLGKSFFTTISPCVVTPEALAPFRTAQAARPAGDPAPLPYLCDAADQATGALDIELEVFLLTPGLKSKALPPQRLSLGNARHLYWTVAQLVAHHSSGGCNLRAGDLFGTGTISAPGDGGLGSLLALSAGGRRGLEPAADD